MKIRREELFLFESKEIEEEEAAVFFEAAQIKLRGRREKRRRTAAEYQPKSSGQKKSL